MSEETTRIEKSPQTIAMLKKIKKEKRKKYLKKHKIKFTLLGIFLALVIGGVVAINLSVFTLYKVNLDNMNSTIQINDMVYIDKRFTKIDTGRVYQFKKDDKVLIDRCIGIGGDHIVIENDKVFINAILVAENYVSSTIDGKINIDVIVPEGKLFFLGDNRKNSWDARYWNERFVDESEIIGEVTKIVYPFDREKEITYY
jgi:signal peptidase I